MRPISHRQEQILTTTLSPLNGEPEPAHIDRLLAPARTTAERQAYQRTVDRLVRRGLLRMTSQGTALATPEGVTAAAQAHERRTGYLPGGGA